MKQVRKRFRVAKMQRNKSTFDIHLIKAGALLAMTGQARPTPAAIENRSSGKSTLSATTKGRNCDNMRLGERCRSQAQESRDV